jgi:ADYC domain
MKFKALALGATAVIALLMLGTRIESAGAAPAPSLTVEGSAFVLEMADGRVLRGIELAGATVHLAVGADEAAPLKLASIVADDEYPDILRHDFQVPDGQGGWKPACEPDAYGERWGFPLTLPEGHPGREHSSLTLACSSGAVGKCARFGYRPWAQGPQGESLMSLHAACVRMVRADYCGNGKAHTKERTTIDTYDDHGIQQRGLADDASYRFEAGWTAQGAVCVHHTRWANLLTREQLLAQCPSLATIPVCNESTARALGARLFNTSRVQASSATGKEIEGSGPGRREQAAWGHHASLRLGRFE